MEGPHLAVVPTDTVLKTVRLSEIKQRSIVWLDKPLVFGEAFTLIAGRKGVGKGTWIAAQIATLTSGLWGENRNALIVSSEDSAAVDVAPRCQAAGADMDRVHIIRDHFILPRDRGRLYRTAVEIGEVGMIVLDPIGNHLNGANTDSEGSVRHAIAELNHLADKLTCVVFGVRHLGKGADRGALASVLGSTAWVDTPRSVLAFAADDEDDMTFHVQMVAGNRSGRNGGCSYRMELVDVGLLEPVTRALRTGDSIKDVEDLLQILPRNRNSKSSAAKEGVLDYLDENGSTESEVLDAKIAASFGVTAKTVRNLRGELSNAGLIKTLPEKDEQGQPRCWNVSRTAAERPERQI